MCEGGRKEKGGKGQYVPSRTLTNPSVGFHASSTSQHDSPSEHQENEVLGAEMNTIVRKLR